MGCCDGIIVSRGRVVPKSIDKAWVIRHPPDSESVGWDMCSELQKQWCAVYAVRMCVMQLTVCIIVSDRSRVLRALVDSCLGHLRTVCTCDADWSVISYRTADRDHIMVCAPR